MKLDQYYNKNIEQETIFSKAEEEVNKLNKISQESNKQIIGVVESTAKGTKRKNADQIIQDNPRNNNDIKNEINRVKKIKKLVKKIDEYDKQNPHKVAITSLIKRYNQDFNDDIANINEKL